LQISLLSGVDVANDPAFQNQTQQRTWRRIVALDVFAQVEKLSYISKVFLLLVPENRTNFFDGFIPHRIGDLRREICIEPASRPTLDVKLPFKRRTLSISQIGNSGPGSPVRFMFRDRRSRAIAGDVTVLEPGSTAMVSSLAKDFTCSGGSFEVNHLCPNCDEQGISVLLVFFGTRGRHSDAWCRISTVSSRNLSIEDSYREIALCSARFCEHASYVFACDLELSVEIEPTMVENLYHITIRLRGLVARAFSEVLGW
jgi:hypothetical protein